MATAVLSTLEHVTFRKLERLSEQADRFERQKVSILEQTTKTDDRREKVRILLRGFKEHGIPLRKIGFNPSNVHKFLYQADHDPSISTSLLQRWQSTLENELDAVSLKYEYARLFGQLVTEWIKNAGPATNIDTPSEEEETFEPVGRQEMHEQRKQWESYAFVEHVTDEKAIEEYLNDLFVAPQQKKHATTPLDNLRETIKNFDNETDCRFTADTVKESIVGLLRSDLYSGSKRKALSDLKNQPAVLQEMADVLNMDLESLDTWEWSPDPVPMEMRRHLNGKYRVFMDEEIHQSILLHYLGTQWAVHIKQAMVEFCEDPIWRNEPQVSLDARDKKRRAHFLHETFPTGRPTVASERAKKYLDRFFMLQLPSSVSETRDYDETEGNKSKNSMVDIKQDLLRLVTTEALLFEKIYGHCTVLQSDFKWFGPSLPHSTIFAVLKFFGVPERWQAFFKKFLQAPLAFKNDGPDAQRQVRKRGIPIGHVLSSALGEMILFCLDFAVNKQTKGANIYRFHDDLWFWGDESRCVEVWKEMTRFSNTMGLMLNEDKTGHVRIGTIAGDKTKPSTPIMLPEGKIRWGFLILESSGKWVIDKQQVDEHIKELKLQLSACHSVFAWIQAFNTYVNQFLKNNFGQPANCFGREHVNMVIETFTYIQRSLFEDSKGSAGSITEYLRSAIKEKFGTTDIPDGFFYLPVELGGLELRNPFVPLSAVHGLVTKDPISKIEEAIEREQDAYEAAKKKYESGEVRYSITHASKLYEDEPFMSYEEFTKAQEQTNLPLQSAYQHLIHAPNEARVTLTPAVVNALEALSHNQNWGKSGFSNDQLSLTPYWRWVLEIYSDDVLDRFGGLSMGDSQLLPIGLVDMLRSEKVRWQG